MLNLKEAKVGAAYHIFDLQGKLLLEGELAAEAQVNVAHLPAGSYILILNSGSNTFKAKFQKK